AARFIPVVRGTFDMHGMSHACRKNKKKAKKTRNAKRAANMSVRQEWVCAGSSLHFKQHHENFVSSNLCCVAQIPPRCLTASRRPCPVFAADRVADAPCRSAGRLEYASQLDAGSCRLFAARAQGIAAGA